MVARLLQLIETREKRASEACQPAVSRRAFAPVIDSQNDVDCDRLDTFTFPDQGRVIGGQEFRGIVGSQDLRVPRHRQKMKAVAEELQDLGCRPRRDDEHGSDLAGAKTIERVAGVVCRKGGLDSELAENQSCGEVTAAIWTADVDSERVELADV